MKGSLLSSEYTEAYSWGVGEYDSEDGVDGGSEGCVRAAVVGVEDAPVFNCAILRSMR